MEGPNRLHFLELRVVARYCLNHRCEKGIAACLVNGRERYFVVAVLDSVHRPRIFTDACARQARCGIDMAAYRQNRSGFAPHSRIRVTPGYRIGDREGTECLCGAPIECRIFVRSIKTQGLGAFIAIIWMFDPR
jgi:hypothetical protein